MIDFQFAVIIEQPFDTSKMLKSHASESEVQIHERATNQEFSQLIELFFLDDLDLFLSTRVHTIGNPLTANILNRVFERCNFQLSN